MWCCGVRWEREWLVGALRLVGVDENSGRKVHYVGRVQPRPGGEPHHLVLVSDSGGTWNHSPLAITDKGAPIKSINGGLGNALRFANVPNRTSGFYPLDSVGGTVALDYPPLGVTWRLTCPAVNALETGSVGRPAGAAWG